TLIQCFSLPEVTLASGRDHRPSMPGSPHNISKNDRGLQQVVLNAAYFFNNESNDAFLFKPATIDRAQKQIVKGVRYIADFQISRTVCHKRDKDNNLSRCDFQPPGPLHQVFQCHIDLTPPPPAAVARLHPLNRNCQSSTFSSVL
uniref:Cystatin F n=1 Tax=Oreochromis niloticus TaxID=8128 RepID=A0A669ENN0_ORENI